MNEGDRGQFYRMLMQLLVGKASLDQSEVSLVTKVSKTQTSEER